MIAAGGLSINGKSTFPIHVIVHRKGAKSTKVVFLRKYRNFKVFGRSQLLLATRHMYAAVHCKSPSTNTVFKNSKSLDFAKQNPT